MSERLTELLPWYVNGTLGFFDRVRTRRHLGRCQACRDEVALQSALRLAVHRVPADPPATTCPAFEKFRTRIQADIDRSADGSLPARGGAFCGAAHGVARFGRSPLAWGALAGLLALTVLPHMSDLDSAVPVHVFHTAASPSSDGGFQPNDVRVVFARHMDSRAIQALLEPMEGRLVDGPSAAGVYTVRFGAPGAPPQLVAGWIERLRANSDVALAEPAIPRDPVSVH